MPEPAKKVFLEKDDLRKGGERMLFIGEDPIAYITDDNVQMGTETEDASSKMSGGWNESMAGTKSWTVTANALVSSSGISRKALIEKWGKSEVFELEIANVVRGIDPSSKKKTFTKGAIINKGLCLITDIQDKSSHGEFESMSITFKGCGPLNDDKGEVGKGL